MVVLWLVVLFLFGIGLLVLLVVLRHGVYRYLVLFVAWLLLMLFLLVSLGVRFLDWVFFIIVGLVLCGNDFDRTEKFLLTSWG